MANANVNNTQRNALPALEIEYSPLPRTSAKVVWKTGVTWLSNSKVSGLLHLELFVSMEIPLKRFSELLPKKTNNDGDFLVKMTVTFF